ncbi:crotonase/enoyl-CoA hydratase family protein [Thalassotalea ponticola]|uniref:crotonase/enoyl-CoA hydratase family protein n=1 Tax=Thalassotalea ponticola TaxID=1523392 RepID=UPI0025B2D5AD|nr:crotonase/enoyl-CoA hydratase family protein [Thalassotalea ponticola]MDN3653370.1 crotonase/enoyl-CoA hydratase family protein [Thalassotalea ponticola]
MITIDIANNIAIVTLARPEKMNALNLAMFKQLKQAIKTLKKDHQVRAIVITAQGENFCSGLDISSVTKNRADILALLFKWLPWRANLAQYVSVGWRQIPVPVIAAISGRCWGGGLQIALGADFRIAHPDASFSIMESKWGLIPDMGGNMALAELMNKDHALKLVMTAEIINASTALQHGLISQESDTPVEAAMQLAQQICQRSPDTVAASKRLYNTCWQRGNGRWLWLETCYQIAILFGKNQRIAVAKQRAKATNTITSKDYQKRNTWW